MLKKIDTVASQQTKLNPSTGWLGMKLSKGLQRKRTWLLSWENISLPVGSSVELKAISIKDEAVRLLSHKYVFDPIRSRVYSSHQLQLRD